MKIVVTGSLGHISKPLVQELLKKGHHVIIISSDINKRKTIQDMGAVAAIGSVEDAIFLAETFKGADAVYTMVPPVNYMQQDLDPVQHFSRIGNNYAQAIRKAGIKRVVNLSSWGAHRDNGTGGIVGTYYLEKIINELPAVVNSTHIRPASFYYNLYGFIPAIKKTGKIAANYGAEDHTVLVAPEDIAAVVAEELENNTPRSFRYVSSEELSCNEVARILGEAIGKPDLRWELITKEQAQQNLEAAGLPSSSAELLVELQEGHHKGLIAEDYYQHKPELGRVKLKDFAKGFALAYQKQVP
ncbi:NmrA family NAD(P)-binding protein [Pedobacter sp. MC2016-15]|uniref:NmrA family NAD(P)-binding protein n=1 Tax=Pedobacter sp. MC2016-15 TaxID=2994473 RepID=UPI002245AA56|nr:NmrA family NAD(P)-binding protein [Pedobacter sp. MC2016-15]MCX2481551.1 NmrA family NAD(P)-binding protein [Pedobacter sp. MC2016-15]